jgi:ABC-type multidrug transport system fused ATPase/permease subunit
MVMASKELIDSAVNKAWAQIIRLGSILTSIVLIQICLKAFTSLISVRLSETMTNSLREKLYFNLSGVSWTEFTKYHSGDIVTRMSNDVTAITDGIVKDIPEIISLGTGLMAAFITLLLLEPILAIFALFLVPIAVLVCNLIGKKFMKLHLKVKEAESSCRSFLQESIEHMLIIKTFCYERGRMDKLHKLHNTKARLTIRSNFTTVSTGSVFSGSYWLSYLFVFYWGAMKLAEGTTTFGTFTAFIQLVGQIQQPFLALAEYVPNIISMAASSKRLMELENLTPESYKTLDPDYILQGINMKKVSFAYKDGSPILKNINAEIKKGDIIGLVGASGEGKTTLIHLLMSLYQPDNGTIYVQGNPRSMDIQQISIRSLISYVPQGNSIFSGTIYENLTIGNPMSSEQEMIEVLKSIGAWEFIDKLPDGLQTCIGERGHGLSEGQSQRIAIARALLRTAPILILDEATSALDTASEQMVVSTLMKFRHNSTCIMITHRPSLLLYCNRIWCLKEGELFEDESLVNEAVTNVVV